MTLWIILNAISGAAVALLLTYKLIVHGARCSISERVGIGMIASGMILNIGPIVARGFPYGEGQVTPFDDWASAMLRIGLIMYFSSRILRHWYANHSMIRGWDQK